MNFLILRPPQPFVVLSELKKTKYKHAQVPTNKKMWQVVKYLGRGNTFLASVPLAFLACFLASWRGRLWRDRKARKGSLGSKESDRIIMRQEIWNLERNISIHFWEGNRNKYMTALTPGNIIFNLFSCPEFCLANHIPKNSGSYFLFLCSFFWFLFPRLGCDDVPDDPGNQSFKAWMWREEKKKKRNRCISNG